MGLVARFVLGDRIGGGDTAELYRAFDRTLGHDVVLHIVRTDAAGDEYVGRVEREAEAASDVIHPNIVRTLDHGVIDGRPFVVRELIEGATLEDLLARRGPLPEDEARTIAEQIARGLEAAHARGVLHRDLNSGKVFVTSDGTAKIVDFGMPSTPRHPAPEQAQDRTIDERADVYGLGAVLYEMLTGRVLRGTTLSARRLSRRVSKTTEAVVRRALESDPDRRFASAGAMAEALRSPAPEARPAVLLPPPRAERIVPERVVPKRVAPPIRSARVMPLDPTQRIVSPPPPLVRRARPTGARRRVSALLLALLTLPLMLALLVGALTLRPPPATNTAVLSATTTPVPTATPTPSVEPTPTTTLVPPVETTPEPTPAPPPPVVAAPPQPPPPLVPVQPNSAAATVRSFYELIQQKRYDEAAALWSPRMKASYPPSTNIYGRFDRTRQIVIRSIAPIATNTGGATVAIDILEVLDSGVTRRWIGTWQLIWDGSRWLMDAPSLRPG
jgi:serine/threonine protein kinase